MNPSASERIRPARWWVVLLSTTLLLAIGCGLRSPRTGSLRGRVMDSTGAIVAGARVYSLHAAEEVQVTGIDGLFYLSELPEGHNQLVVTHDRYEVHHETVTIEAGRMAELERVVLDRPNQSQLISGVRVESVASVSLVMQWETDRAEVCEVEIGTSTRYGRIVREDPDPRTSHRLTIRDLTPETVYHLRVRMPHPDGGYRVSQDVVARTLGGDRPRPSPAIRIATVTVAGNASMTWDASPSPVTSYRIYRRERGRTDWTRVTTDGVSAAHRAFTDTAVPGGRWYDYQVEAIGVDGAPSLDNPIGRVFMPGHVLAETRFTLEDSPVVLTGDLIIEPGVNLTIDPGVEIRIAASDSLRLGDDPDRISLLVKGRLQAQGTPAAPIRFTPLDGRGQRDHWAGIELRSFAWISDLADVELFGTVGPAVSVVGLPANLSGLAIRYAHAGIGLERVTSRIDVASCSFEDLAGAAVYSRGCRRVSVTDSFCTEVDVGIDHQQEGALDDLVVARCRLGARTAGIRARLGRSVIKNNLVVAKSGTGMIVTGLGGITNVIDHNTIDARVGIEISGGVPTIENNLIVSTIASGVVGIRAAAELGIPRFQFNDVYNFGVPYENAQADAGALNVDPRFFGTLTGSDFDYRLGPLSPVAQADRHGGEMGAYGRSYY